MAAVYFTTIPCKPNAAKRHIENQFFFYFLAKFVPVLTNIAYACFEVSRTFLSVRFYERFSLGISYAKNCG